MNLKSFLYTVSYHLKTLKPNIKRRFIRRRELKKSNISSKLKLKILVGIHPVWEKIIRDTFQDSPHQVFFEQIDESNIAKYDLVIPLNIQEINVLNQHTDLIQKNIIPIPNTQALNICDDKLLFYEYMNCKGFGEYIPRFGKPLSYPYVLKKRIAHFGMDSEVIRNQEDEKRFAENIHSQDYILQEYILGKHEFAAHVLFKDGVIVSCLTIKHFHRSKIYIRGHKKEETIFSEVTKNRFLPVFSAMLQAIGFEGMCCIDYKVINGKLFVFEINPRIGSSCIEYLLKFINSVNTQTPEMKTSSLSK